MSSSDVACASCGEKSGTQRCPTCRELGAQESESLFCSKECFQAAWPTHKLLHKQYKLAAAASARFCPWRGRFSGYDFTGSLRPWPVTAQDVMPVAIQRPDYSETSVPKSENAERGRNTISVWSSAEAVQAMRRAGEIAREITDLASRALAPGVTAEFIDKLVYAACVEREVYPSPLNYNGFPKSWCAARSASILSRAQSHSPPCASPPLAAASASTR
jgi:methionyl aminopeptidase